MNSRILTLASLALLATSTVATAGSIYQLNFECEGPAPTLPATITVDVYEGDTNDPGKLKGSSTEIFNGNGNITGHTCDAFMCLTDTRILSNNGNLFLTFQTNGFDKGKLKSNTYWEITINGVTSSLQFHTSCSQPIPLNQPLDVGNGMTCTLVGGYGDCLPGSPGCPTGDKLFEINGQYRIDVSGCTPSDLVFNVYKKDNELKGTSTATWNGASLTNIVCDGVACLTGAELQGSELVITFDSSGYKDTGEFESDTSWEMLVTGCAGGKTQKIHTSCSQVFTMGTSYPAGSGEFVFTGGCGACLSFAPVGTEDASWGGIKAGYR